MRGYRNGCKAATPIGTPWQDSLRDWRDTGGSSEFAVLVRREAKMATGLAGY